jgi:hypothetical protein
MPARLVPGEYDQLHHFIADGVWDASPLEFAVLRLWAAPTILMARKVHRQHVHNSDGLAENLFGCGGQIVGIVGFDFCGAVFVWHEHVPNTVVNAFHPHPEAKSVKFARAYQGI